jgi:AcrR family transcriptional regulator
MSGSTVDAPQGLRARKKEQTRQLIAETARRLFTERGFERVTVAEVARAADVAEQTVFNYFPSKEDLVYWRLEPFEQELLQTIRDRERGESVLAAFKRFLLARRGLLGKADPEARERLAALTRMIAESSALLAREQQILAGYTEALAALIVEDTGARAGAVQPFVAANAMVGVHRFLIDYTRRRIVAGAMGPRLARDVRAQAEQAFALLEEGLGDYGRRV